MPSERSLTAAPRLPAAASVTARLRQYVELMKPTIILLLLITTVPAMVVAADGWPDTWLVIATLIGGTLSAGGAGALNHVLDRDIDGLMERTRDRPIPSGAVSVRAATAFGIALAGASVGWLLWQVNATTAALSLAAVLFYVVVYTYGLKRRTAQNIVIGGAAGAAPPVIGWAAVTGSVEVEPLLLFLLIFSWTPPHFWALSLRVSDDYREAGVPMAPLVWGVQRTKRLILLYSLLLVAISVVFGALAELRWIYFAVATAGGAGFLALAARLHASEGDAGAMRLFFFSMFYLAGLFASMLVDTLLL